MPFFFNNHPSVDYNIATLNSSSINKTINVQNLLARYKLKDALKNRTPLYYTHSVEEGQSPSFIAHRYYGDESLDWIIFIVNDIIDPFYDWPLSYEDLIAFIKSKYGSVPTAQATIHHYEKILSNQSILYDGTIIPERYVEVDLTTYTATPSDSRREIDCYTFELKENEKKRNIKILHRDFVPDFLNEAESIFE